MKIEDARNHYQTTNKKSHTNCWLCKSIQEKL